MAPRIAIPMPHSTDREYGERAIPQYERAVTLAGGEPVRVALDQTADEIRKVVERCDGVLLPGYAGYPNTAAASLVPTNADVADLAHLHGAVVGYVHPYEEQPQPLTAPAHTDADELPVDVAPLLVDVVLLLLWVVGVSEFCWLTLLPLLAAF